MLKRTYDLYVESLMRRYQTHIAKKDFLPDFLEAFTAVFTKSTIRSDFETSELVPLNADRVISALDISEIVRTPSLNSKLSLPF